MAPKPRLAAELARLRGREMVDITTLNGTVLSLDDNDIVRVAGPMPGDPQDRSYVTGPAPDPVAANEGVQTLLARVHPTTPLVQLTRPDGSPVWIKGGAVSLVRPPIPDDIPAGERVGAVLIVGGHHQAVQEDVPMARSVVNQHGGNV
jgi:hypothetical protein